MNNVYLLTGGNLGNRTANLALALAKITMQVGRLLNHSQVYETAAWGITDQQPFLNQVLLVESELNAQTILHHILAIENEMGRTRTQKFGPRLIDIDILFFNNEVIVEDNLRVPHPEIPNRRFVLVPLSEIAADHIHPTLFRKISTLLHECTDRLPVKLFTQTT